MITRKVGDRLLKHSGGCHCGNIDALFESDIDPWQIKIRACQCSFCRKHGAESVSDPAGRLSLKIADQEQLIRYRFGFETAEFLICAVCGVYVVAMTRQTDQPRAILQLRALDDAEDFVGHVTTVDYGSESETVRRDRREKVWMPISINLP
jgi:hypothetical protein